MNAPFAPTRDTLRLADLSQADECARIEAFVARHPQGAPFHRPVWLQAVARGTGAWISTCASWKPLRNSSCFMNSLATISRRKRRLIASSRRFAR